MSDSDPPDNRIGAVKLGALDPPRWTPAGNRTAEAEGAGAPAKPSSEQDPPAEAAPETAAPPPPPPEGPPPPERSEPVADAAVPSSVAGEGAAPSPVSPETTDGAGAPAPAPEPPTLERREAPHAPSAADSVQGSDRESPPALGPGYTSAYVAPRRREGFRLSRGLVIGGVAALLVGTALALALRPRLEEGEPAPSAAAETANEAPAEARPPTAAASEPFQPPSREAVRLAYQRAAEVYGAQGASGLAQFGQQCFRSLEGGATYRQLDFCLAFDAYGAAIAQKAAGGQAPSPETYFGQTEARQFRVAEAVMAGQSDASARLIDIRRLAIEVAREAGPVAPVRAVDPAPTAPAPPAPAPSVSPPPPAAAEAPRPRPVPPASRASTPPAQPSPAAPREPAAAPVRRAEAPPMPTAEEVAAARPSGPGPSFSCRSARTRSERMVCADPSLARLDRRLNAAFEDAIAAGVDRRTLRREQDRWLATRESAAPDPQAVADAYRRRIDELDSMR